MKGKGLGRWNERRGTRGENPRGFMGHLARPGPQAAWAPKGQLDSSCLRSPPCLVLLVEPSQGLDVMARSN
jgi:hypothetical protein